MNIEDIEIESQKKGEELLHEMLVWLAKANIDYKLDSWESGEGREIVINKIKIVFYDSGYVNFELEGEDEQETN